MVIGISSKIIPCGGIEYYTLGVKGDSLSLVRPVSNSIDLYSNGRWIIAKYHSLCPCGKHISPKENLWYVPYKKQAYCQSCGYSIYPPDLKKLLDIDP